MAFNLQITDTKNGINFNAKYENLSNYQRPEIEARAQDGTEVKQRMTHNGTILPPGSTQRQWVDEQGNVYSKNELKFFYEGEEVHEVSKTKVFEINEFQPVVNYTDKYIIDKYYEISPSNNGMKKDYDREMAIKGNLSQMYKLWKYLTENDVVARGEFNVGTQGFTFSDGYIRAISIEGKWSLEIGCFKEEKIFQHLNEGEPKEVEASVQAGGRKRLKLV